MSVKSPMAGISVYKSGMIRGDTVSEDTGHRSYRFPRRAYRAALRPGKRRDGSFGPAEQQFVACGAPAAKCTDDRGISERVARGSDRAVCAGYGDPCGLAWCD